MTIDALSRLAYLLSETNGTYAVLLGSGISSAAGIPTGWDIAMDLIPKIAALQGEDLPEDPEEWYQRRIDRPVNYSEIVQTLGSTQAERSRLLSSYIEPDDDDIRAGRKQPTLAHRAIAKLAKYGCIRVIVTTNIDQLMESALAAEHVHPVLVSSQDDIEGMIPLSQSQNECIVFKVHGDYKDIRSLNTASELERYPERIDRLLDQIFADFGMVVCGWSARWDFALCNAVKRSVARLYSWFWAEHGVSSEAAKELIASREAQCISIDDADSFFDGVRRTVERLKGIESQDPEPVEQGVAILQSYLRQQPGLGNSDFAGDLSAVVSQLFALSNSAVADQEEGGESNELSRQIDFARDLIGRGLVVQARIELDRIRTTSDPVPEDVQLRIATNLAACAMAEEDVEGAVYWSEEAYRLQPGNPAVVANAALAAHRADDLARALELAQKARELNPVDSPASSVIMVEMWREGQFVLLDEFVASQEWVNEDAQCALVLASIRLLQSRFGEAVSLCRGRVGADAQDAHAHLALSQCLLKSMQAASAVVAYTEDDLSLLEEVISEVTLAIDLLKATDLKFQRHAALILRGCARAMIGLNVEAMSDFDEVLRERQNSSEAIFYKGLLHLNDGRAEDAVAWFERVEDGSQLPDLTVPFAQSLLSSGRHSKAVDLLRESFDLSSPGWEDVHRAELLFRAETLADVDSTVVPALEVGLQESPDNPVLLALTAVVRDDLGDHDGAEKALLRALDSVDADGHVEIVMRLGYHYQARDRFSEGADRFREVVGENALHPLAISLLLCLTNCKRLSEALALSRDIQRLVRNVPRVVVDIELDILELVGDADSAVLLRQQLCGHPEATSVDRVELAIAQVRAADFDGARKTVQEITPGSLTGYPVSLLDLAKIKKVVGVEGYLVDAYSARRSAMNEAQVHLGYFSLFAGREQEISEPDEVGSGCAVYLRGDAGEQWWSIVDRGEQPVGSHDLELDSGLASALVGKRVGETVVLREGVEDLQYEVVAIQSKYVRAYQETAAEFSTRFPNNMGLSRVAVDVEDPSKFLQLVDQRDKFVREVEQTYREGVLPLVAFASRVGKFPFEFWSACTQYGFTRILFGFGVDEETDRAAVLLHDVDAIVLDTVALFTVHELGMIDLLRERFDRVALPQLVFDSLQNWAAESRTMGRKSGFIGRSEDGFYTFSEASEDLWSKWQEQVESVLNFASSLEHIPSYGLLDLSDSERLLVALTPAGAGAVWAGKENPGKLPILVSDDLALSKVAWAFGKDAVNTQALLLDCHRSGALSDVDYSRLIARLAAMNYWFVRVKSEDIINNFVESGYITTDGTRAMLRTLQGPECSEDAAVGVTANVVVGLWSRTVPGQFDLILGLVLSTLQRGRGTGVVLLKFEQAIETDRRLSLIARQRILATIAAYRFGGMTGAGSGLIVLR